MSDAIPNPPVSRDEKGRVLPGSKLGKGNLARGRMAKLKRVLINSVSPQKVLQAEAKLFSLFMDGDMQAAKLWMDHVLGKPLTQIEMTSRSGHSATLTFVLSAINQAVPDPEMRDHIAHVIDQLCEQEEQQKKAQKALPRSSSRSSLPESKT